MFRVPSLPQTGFLQEDENMAERTARQQLDSACNCVVIGAGNGGLGAAVQLAARGASVLELEQHSVPVPQRPRFAASTCRDPSAHGHRRVEQHLSEQPRLGARENVHARIGMVFHQLNHTCHLIRHAAGHVHTSGAI